MLVIQLELGLFLVMMRAKNASYTEEGLLLLWSEYTRGEKEMPGEDILVNLDSVASAFCEESIFDFVEYRLNEVKTHRHFPLDLRNMDDSAWATVKEEIQVFLGKKFIGFTKQDRVVFKR